MLLAEEQVQPVVDGEVGQRVFDDLALYYQSDIIPDLDKAFSNLAKGNIEQKDGEWAGAYLHAMLLQLLADESNGRSKWVKLPYWGGGSKNKARDYRKELAKLISQKVNNPNGLAAILWLINEDKSDKHNRLGIDGLKNIKGAESDAVIINILKNGHPNSYVLSHAINEVEKRKLTQAKEILLAMRYHHRQEIRKVASEAIAKLKINVESIDWQDEKALESEYIKNFLRDLAKMILEKVPDDASWKHFVYTDIDEMWGDEHPEKKVSGWLLKEDESNYEVLNYFNKIIVISKKHAKMSDRAFADEAQWIATMRSKSDQDAMESLSSAGGLTGQFEASFLSLPELLIAVWSYQNGDMKSAAKILLPCFKRVTDDRWIGWAMQDMFGHQYHQTMLSEFSLLRNYDKAAKLAGHLSQDVFNDYRYQDRAKELYQQIRLRSEDFKTLVLPAPAEWERLKQTLSRKAQVAYLAKRMRLLNCIQMSQPGGVSYSDKQTRDSLYAQNFEDRVTVINPYNELKHMKLNVGELKHLVPWLSDDNYMLVFSYWRDFHPTRTFHRVNWAIADIINDVAKRDLANLEKFTRLSDKGRKLHIQQMISWCEENASKTKKDLLLDTLRKTDDWVEFDIAASEASEAGIDEILPIIEKRLADFSDKSSNLAAHIYTLNSRAAVTLARQWVNHQDEGTRFWSALILIRYGRQDENEGLDVIKLILNKDDGDNWYPRAIEGLLASKFEPAMQLADGILKKSKFDLQWNGNPVLIRLFLAGRKNAYAYIIKQFDSNDPGTFENTLIADEITEIVAGWRNNKHEYDTSWPNGRKMKYRNELKAWLKAQFSLIQKGENSEINAELRKMYFPEWRLDHP